MLIFRRSNSIVTASGIVILRKKLFSAPVESGLHSALNRCTEWLLTENDDTNAVTIQFYLLRISIVLFETCRGL